MFYRIKLKTREGRWGRGECLHGDTQHFQPESDVWAPGLEGVGGTELGEPSVAADTHLGAPALNVTLH